jgi:hypothetical protein
MLGCRETEAHTHWQGQALNCSAFATASYQCVLQRCMLNTGDDASRVLTAAVLTVKPLLHCQDAYLRLPAASCHVERELGNKPAACTHWVSSNTTCWRGVLALVHYTSLRLVVTPMLCMGCRT